MEFDKYITYSRYLREYIFYWITTNQTAPIVCCSIPERNYAIRVCLFLSGHMPRFDMSNNVLIPMDTFPYLEEYDTVFYIPQSKFKKVNGKLLFPEYHTVYPTHKLLLTRKQENIIKSADEYETNYVRSNIFMNVDDSLFDAHYYSRFPEALEEHYRLMYEKVAIKPYTASVREKYTLHSLETLYKSIHTVEYLNVISFELIATVEHKPTIYNPFIEYMDNKHPEIHYKIVHHQFRSFIHLHNISTSSLDREMILNDIKKIFDVMPVKYSIIF
jgi:hypothetical protein